MAGIWLISRNRFLETTTSLISRDAHTDVARITTSTNSLAASKKCCCMLSNVDANRMSVELLVSTSIFVTIHLAMLVLIIIASV